MTRQDAISRLRAVLEQGPVRTLGAVFMAGYIAAQWVGPYGRMSQLEAADRRQDSSFVAHLLVADRKNLLLDSVSLKVKTVDVKVDALSRLKCFEARDIPLPTLRKDAFDRLILSQIDCVGLLANRVPGR